MKTGLRGAILGLIASLLAVTGASAQQANTYRLSDFYSGDSTLRLEGKKAEAFLSIPLSSVAKVTSATLDLKAVSSVALVNGRSILNVRFNNATIAQIRYDSEAPNLTSTVTIPSSLWREGFNLLTFMVSQHYANQCVDGVAPELWSEIDLYRSTLTLSDSTLVTSPTLQNLSGYFNPGIGGQRSVDIFAADNVSADVVSNALPKVAQALALRNQYQPLDINYQTLPSRGELPAFANDEAWTDLLTSRYWQSSWYMPAKSTGVHVLVGTKATLADYLSETTLNKLNGASLLIERTPDVRILDRILVAGKTRLIVSGDTPEQVTQAASALSLMDDALNPDAMLSVVDGGLSTTSANVQAHVLHPGRDYTFMQMGVGGAQFRGENAFNKRITAVLPADFYVPESASVKLYLDFGYGAAMGPGSMMNILINDELVHGLPLNNPNGQAYRDYQLTVPARLFKGGVNNIDVEVTQRAPLAGVPCDDISGSHMVFQLHDTSHITFPKAASVAVQPDLGLFAETSYPFAQYTSNVPAAIVVEEPAMLSGALTLAGKMAQVLGTPLSSLTVNMADTAPEVPNVIVLGTPTTLTAPQSEALNTSLAATKQWPYRLQNELHNRVKKALDDKAHKLLHVSGSTTQVSSLGSQAVLVAQENTASRQTGTLFVIAAENAATLNDRITDLVSLGLWGQLAGDFFSWNSADRPLLAMQVTSRFEMGEPADTWLMFRLWLSNNPWYWFAAVLGLVILCSLLAYMLLRRRNQRISQEW